MTKNFNSSNKPPVVALITNDVVGEHMAGPGIRYWELARVLERYTPVKLIVPPFVTLDSKPSTEVSPTSLYVCTRLEEFRNLVEECDVIITLGLVLFYYPFLTELGKPLVLDMYIPFLLEGLQAHAEASLLDQITSYQHHLKALKIQLRAGDFFICADEKQRGYLLGFLSALGRINPYTHQQDHTLRRLIDVVPFGLPTKSPQHTRPVLKGVYKTIAADDPVLIWTGGIWNWFDALTLIKAMPIILQEHPKTKLFFMGINRPNKNIKRMKAVDQTITLSQELGLYKQSVFFNDWVPYDERQNYLLEADIGVSLHLDHAETRFSFRTRILDHLWTGLPTVSTRGDAMSESLASQDLIYLVEPGDVQGVAQTIINLLNNPTLRADHAAQFKQVVDRYRWEVVAQPLIKFCTNPYIAPDKPHLGSHTDFDKEKNEAARLLSKSWQALRLGGLSGLLKQGNEYVRWKIDEYRKL